MTDATTTESPLPTDAGELAAFMKTADDDAVNAMYNRLVADLGQDRAGDMWTSACRELDYDTAVDEAIESLKKNLTAIVLATHSAEREVRRLTEGDAWHVEFAEGSIGRDLADFLRDIGRGARAAEALYGKAMGDPR